MRAKSLTLSVAGAVCTAAGLASGQITTTGPFTGPYTEGFDTQGYQAFPQCINGRVFNNRADLCTVGGNGCDITSGWGFMCTIFPHSAGAFFGSASGVATFTFDIPVNQFGGYFGTNCGTDGGVATFYDASQNIIGTAAITTAGCTWTWNGWHSTTPFRSVSVATSVFGGAFMMIDDMEYSPDENPPPPGCYANCDGSTAIPFLNVNDFVCFQTQFAAGATYANCDHSTTPPVLNVNDFICFQTNFAAGCSAP